MINTKISWKEVHASILKCGDVSLSQGVCQNIAADLNAAKPLELSDIEMPAIGPCHGKALRDHMRKGGDPADFDPGVTDEDINKTRRFLSGIHSISDEPDPQIVHLTDKKPPGKPVVHAAYCTCSHCKG
jgi:hypothetical protein